MFDEINSINNEMTAFIVDRAYIKGFSDAHKIQDEAIKYGKEINNPFRNWTVQEVLKDLKVSEATANAIFRRNDFPFF